MGQVDPGQQPSTYPAAAFSHPSPTVWGENSRKVRRLVDQEKDCLIKKTNKQKLHTQAKQNKTFIH